MRQVSRVMPDIPILIDRFAPALFAVLLWWSATGLILYLDGRPRHTHRSTLLGATGLLAISLYGLAWSASSTTAGSAYIAFACGVGVWAWNEVAFLMGYVTGPRRESCPEGCGGWRHVGHAIETILYHELAILASACVVLVLTWGAPNTVGAWTFVALWWMRQSAKLNVFLGIPNANEEFLPEHLDYLKRFFTKAPMNLLFPVSVTLCTLAAAWLVVQALDAPAGGFEFTRWSLLASLVALGLLEHWFLVLPVPSVELWRWGFRSRKTAEAVDSTNVLLLHRRGEDSGPALQQEPPKRSRDR